MSEFLTTKELAELLRIKERKVYDLAASGEIPCSRAMGKLLFPRNAIDAWLAGSGSGFSSTPKQQRPSVFLGSHDPLLEWALRESRCGIATFFDGSLDGLLRFAKGEGSAAGLHLFDPPSGEWNIADVQSRFGGENVVLMEWAKRQRGLIVAADNKKKITGLDAVKGARIVPRQSEAGSQRLFEHLLAEAGISKDDVAYAPPVRNENDAALTVLEGKADAAFGLSSLAHQLGLDFIPLITERFDLLVDRKFWFEPAWQVFVTFCQSAKLSAKASSMPGYDVSEFGRVHFNA